MFTELTNLLDGFLEMDLPFYDCIVMRDGKEIYRHQGGFTDPERTQRPTGNERYNIYSCSKLIACVAGLQLLERGAFSLDDPISKYLPMFENMTVKTEDGVRPAKNPILVKHLFTMTAGFSYDFKSPGIQKSMASTNGAPSWEVMENLAQDPLLFDPGEGWHYSLCHDVLSGLIEAVSGETLDAFAKKNIFSVLGMNDTTFLPTPEEEEALVTHYEHTPAKGLYVRSKHARSRLGYRFSSGGGGAVSTVADYMKLLEALRVGGILLKDETMKYLQENQLTPQQMEQYIHKNKCGYSLGQRCPKDDTRHSFGWGGAAGAYYFVNRKYGITCYLAAHMTGNQPYQDARRKVETVVMHCLKLY